MNVRLVLEGLLQTLWMVAPSALLGPWPGRSIAIACPARATRASTIDQIADDAPAPWIKSADGRPGRLSPRSA